MQSALDHEFVRLRQLQDVNSSLDRLNDNLKSHTTAVRESAKVSDARARMLQRLTELLLVLTIVLVFLAVF